MAKSNLSAQQKRTIFKRRMAEILPQHGFQLHGDRFIRYHEREILLSVSLDLSDGGAAKIRFGGRPLCVEHFDPLLKFGVAVEEFGKIYPLEDIHRLRFEDGEFDLQFDLFRDHLLEPFAEIENTAALLAYQERWLEDRLGAMPVDWACRECIYLRDYDRAARYALVWQKLKEEALEEYTRKASEAIEAGDFTRRDRKYKLKDLEAERRWRMHGIYNVQRLAGMMEDGIFNLLQQNIAEYIDAADAAFRNAYPDYRYKE